jgi:hypothetical protein
MGKRVKVWSKRDGAPARDFASRSPVYKMETVFIIFR